MLDEAVTKLKQVRATIGRNAAFNNIIDARDQVFNRYQTVFSAEAIPNLTDTEFLGFLLFENNKHWTTLHRHGPQICEDMAHLRAALLQLHNDSVPIEERFDVALQTKHLGKGIISAILQVMQPDKWGVWNGPSEAALKRLDIWPDLDRGVSQGARYRAINGILQQLKGGISIDLWELDALLWITTLDYPDPTYIDIETAIDHDFAAVEGLLVQQQMIVRSRDTRLAKRFVQQRQRKRSLICDKCRFDPVTLINGAQVNARTLLDVHHLHPLEAGCRKTTLADFALLCPTCHRFEHALLKVQART